VAAKSKNYRYSTNHQVVIRADTQLVVVVGTPLPGNRNDSVAVAASGVDNATRTATVIADGGYQGTRAGSGPSGSDGSGPGHGNLPPWRAAQPGIGARPDLASDRDPSPGARPKPCSHPLVAA
jgi:hypothetical protein